MMDNEQDLSIEGLVRLDILRAAKTSGKSGAHIAPSLSVVEICLALLGDDQDHFVLSKGYGALGYYAVMHNIGMITDEQFDSFEKDGGEFPGQPSRSTCNKVEYSSGSLGMGLSYSLGLALGMKRNHSVGKVYVVVGDGELNEGSNWEAAVLAARYDLDNLVVVVDNNGLQSDGKCSDITGQDLNGIWNACGWCVEKCDGHSVDDIKRSLAVSHEGKPLVVIADTIKGKGVSFMENNNMWHHASINDEDYENAIREIRDKYGLC